VNKVFLCVGGGGGGGDITFIPPFIINGPGDHAASCTVGTGYLFRE